MNEPIDNQKCFANHIGTWLMKPDWLTQALSAIQAGIWKPGQSMTAAAPILNASRTVRDPTNEYKKLYEVTNDGLAVISIDGPMMKFDSKYGGANTTRIRRALRAVSVDAEVGGTMLLMDSPGGHVAGTMELGDDIRAAGKVKPVHSFASDLCASACYWAASQSARISVNAIGEVGSIGVVAVLHDYSKMFEAAGVKVHVISTGSMKGAGTEGTEVTEEQLAYFQKMVDDVNQFFLAAVQKGRGMSAKKLGEIADGRVFIASEALSHGLVDAVETFDQAMASLKKAVNLQAASVKQAARARTAQLKLGIEEAE